MQCDQPSLVVPDTCCRNANAFYRKLEKRPPEIDRLFSLYRATRKPQCLTHSLTRSPSLLHSLPHCQIRLNAHSKYTFRLLLLQREWRIGLYAFRLN